MADDSYWVERAQSAEAKLTTCQGQIEAVKERFRNVMETLGAKVRSDGSVDIDFEALVARLSPEHALQLRAEIDKRHRIAGAPGEKPRISITA